MKLIATERVMRPMALRPELGNPSRFPAWTQDADPKGTADARLLIRADLRKSWPDELRRSAQAALNAIRVKLLRDAEARLATTLEKTSILARRALAEARVAIRRTRHAPPDDRREIAAVVLIRAPAASNGLAEAKGRARQAAARAMKRIAIEREIRPTAARRGRGNVDRFLAWADKADPIERANAVGALAQAYLGGNLPDQLRRGATAGHIATLDELRRDAEVCLTTMVNDASTLVRGALAEALADAHSAPRHVISALADDQPEIAAIVLQRSPMLNDAELIEYAAMGGESAEMAVARRSVLSARVAAALAENERREVAMALIENPGADLTPAVLRGIAERFDEEGEVRDALLSRRGLPAPLRFDLIATAMKTLPLFASPEQDEKRIERMLRDVSERVAILVANSCSPDETRALMRHLRAMGALTAALLVRALVSGGRGFFEAAAAELTNVSPERVAGFTRDPFGMGFTALYRRMGLPPRYLAPFRTALEALKECDKEGSNLALRPILSRVIACCEGEGSSGLSGLLCLLRRLEAEAAVEEVRALTERAAAQRAVELFREQGALAAPIAAAPPPFAAAREIAEASLAA